MESKSAINRGYTVNRVSLNFIQIIIIEGMNLFLYKTPKNGTENLIIQCQTYLDCKWSGLTQN